MLTIKNKTKTRIQIGASSVESTIYDFRAHSPYQNLEPLEFSIVYKIWWLLIKKIFFLFSKQTTLVICDSSKNNHNLMKLVPFCIKIHIYFMFVSHEKNVFQKSRLSNNKYCYISTLQYPGLLSSLIIISWHYNLIDEYRTSLPFSWKSISWILLQATQWIRNVEIRRIERRAWYRWKAHEILHWSTLFLCTNSH